MGVNNNESQAKQCIRHGQKGFLLSHGQNRQKQFQPHAHSALYDHSTGQARHAAVVSRLSFLTGRKLGSNLLKREKYAEPGAPGGRLPGVKNAPLTRLSWCLMIPEHARFIHPAPVTHCRCLTPFCALNAPARNSPGNQSASEISCNILVTKDTHNGGG